MPRQTAGVPWFPGVGVRVSDIDRCSTATVCPMSGHSYTETTAPAQCRMARRGLQWKRSCKEVGGYTGRETSPIRAKPTIPTDSLVLDLLRCPGAELWVRLWNGTHRLNTAVLQYSASVCGTRLKHCIASVLWPCLWSKTRRLNTALP